MTDSELLAAYVGGSEEAFRILVERYIHVVYGAARRQAWDSAAAEDVTQAVFMVLARRAKGIRDGRTLAAWLLRVTKFCAIDARRSAVRRRHHEQGAAVMKAMLTKTEDIEASQRVLAQLDMALEELGAIDRTAIVLRYMREQPMAEIGMTLGVSEEAAKKRVARAVEKLRKAFGRRGISVSPGVVGAKIAEQAVAAPPGLVTHVCAGALAKGISVSAAAVMAKGAVKLMAWTTTKLVAGAALAVVVLGVGVFGVVKVATERPPREPVVAMVAAATTRSSVPLQPITPYAPVTVGVRDIVTGQPLANVHVDIIANSLGSVAYSRGHPVASAVTAVDGKAVLPVPPEVGNRFQLQVSKENYVPVEVGWVRHFPSDQPPKSFPIVMEKAVSVGGTVVDQNDKPVEGAMVSVNVQKKSGDPLVPWGPYTTTDALGHWSLNVAPEQCDVIRIAVTHPTALTDNGLLPYYPVPVPQLRDQSATIRIVRGSPVHGVVRGPDGRPRKAWISVGSAPAGLNSTPEVATDDLGRFEFGITKGAGDSGPTLLVARAEGCATGTTMFKPGQGDPVVFDLKLSSPLNARFVDSAGHAIANVAVTVDSWKDVDEEGRARYRGGITPAFVSDAQGRIRWEEAVNADVRVNVEAAGYVRRSRVDLAKNGANEITLARLYAVRGRVLDAETGRPIEDFHVVQGSRYSADSVDWQDYPEDWQDNFRVPATGGKPGDGSFEFSDPVENGPFILRAQGDNYAPMNSEVLSGESSQKEVIFRMSKGERFAAQLLDIDGKPAAHVRVRVNMAALDVYDADFPVSELDEKLDPRHFATTNADGRFSFPPQEGTFVLLAATKAGYLLAKSPTLAGQTTFQLTAWAAIEGTVLIDGRPAPKGHQVEGGFYDPGFNDSMGPFCHFTPAVTDERGHFSFPKVFAFPFFIDNITNKSIDIPPGETTRIVVDETRRRISHVYPPDALP